MENSGPIQDVAAAKKMNLPESALGGKGATPVPASRRKELPSSARFLPLEPAASQKVFLKILTEKLAGNQGVSSPGGRLPGAEGNLPSTGGVALPTPGLPGGKDSSPAVDPAAARQMRLEAAAKEMESFFLTLLLKKMRETIPKTSLLHGEGSAGEAEETFIGMMDEELGKIMAGLKSHGAGGTGSHGIGLARMIVRQLLHQTNELRLDSSTRG